MHRQKVQELRTKILPPQTRVCLLADAGETDVRLQAVVHSIGAQLRSLSSSSCLIVPGLVGLPRICAQSFVQATSGSGKAFAITTKDCTDDLPGASIHNLAESEYDLSLMLGEVGSVYVAVEGRSLLPEEVVAARRKGAVVLPILRRADGSEGPIDSAFREEVLQKPPMVPSDPWQCLVHAQEPAVVAAAAIEILQQVVRTSGYVSELEPSRSGASKNIGFSNKVATTQTQSLHCRSSEPRHSPLSLASARRASSPARVMPVHVPVHRLSQHSSSSWLSEQNGKNEATGPEAFSGPSDSATPLVAAMLKVLEAFPEAEMEGFEDLRQQLVKVDAIEQRNMAWLEAQNKALVAKVQSMEELCSRVARALPAAPAQGQCSTNGAIRASAAATLKVLDAFPQAQSEEFAEFRQQLVDADEEERRNNASLEAENMALLAKVRSLEELCDRFATAALPSAEVGTLPLPQATVRANLIAMEGMAQSDSDKPVQLLAAVSDANANQVQSENPSGTSEAQMPVIVQDIPAAESSLPAETSSPDRRYLSPEVVAVASSTGLSDTPPVLKSAERMEALEGEEIGQQSLSASPSERSPQPSVLRASSLTASGRTTQQGSPCKLEELYNWQASTVGPMIPEQRVVLPLPPVPPLWPSATTSAVSAKERIPMAASAATCSAEAWQSRPSGIMLESREQLRSRGTSALQSRARDNTPPRSRGVSPTDQNRAERRLKLLTNMEQLESLTRRLERMGCISDTDGLKALPA